jgi:hypothetical protein
MRQLLLGDRFEICPSSQECAIYGPFARGAYLYEMKGFVAKDRQPITGCTCVRNPILEAFCVQG